MSEERGADAARAAFHAVYGQDLAQRRIRPRAEYLALFPGHEAAIGAEFDLLEDAPTQRGAEARLPAAIGPYRIRREIGRGGQAIVYLAEHVELRRVAALKVLHAPALDFEAVQRFRREAEATARLDHPHICSVYETGEADGRQWIAMRYVEGASLANLIAKSRGQSASTSGVRLPPEDGRAQARDVEHIVRLVERCALALHAAHEQGLVHRDVKPHNILVAPSGEPVLLDFGLARDETSAEQSLTHSGERIGTPYYMSPEQVRGERVDRRTDVYSLGVVLYECLTLQRPYEAPTRAALGARILAGGAGDPRQLNPRIGRELRTVIETAIDRDPSRRYATALDLALDLRRILAFEPIRARPAPLVLRLRRWTQRHKVAAAFMALLALGLALVSFLLGQVADEKRSAEQALDEARALNLVATSEAVHRADATLSLLLALEAVRAAQTEDTITQLHRVMARLHPVRRLVSETRPATWWATVQFPRADRLVAQAQDARSVAVWDLSGREVASARHEAPCFLPLLAPQGDRLAILRQDGVLELREADRVLATIGGAERRVRHVPPWQSGVARRLFVMFADGGIELFDWGGRKERDVVPPGAPVHSLDFGADRLYVLLTTGVRVFDGDGQELFASAWPPGEVGISRCGRDGRPIAVVAGGRAYWSDGRPGSGFAPLGDDEPCATLSVSLSGSRILTVHHGSARLWTGAGLPIGRLVLANGLPPLPTSTISPDGDRIATRHADGSIALWDGDGKLVTLLPQVAGAGETYAFWSPDGDRFLLFTPEGVGVYDRDGHEHGVVPRFFEQAAFAPDGTAFATGEHGAVRVWPSSRPGATWLMGERSTLFGLRAAAGRLASVAADGRLRVWDRQTGQPICAVAAWPVARDTHFALSPDGARLATNDSLVGPQFHARLFDVATGELERTLPHGREPILGVSFSPDGREILTGSYGKARAWPLSGGEPIVVADDGSQPGPAAAFETEGFWRFVNQVARAPHEDVFLAAHNDGSCRVWTRQGKLLHTLGGPPATVTRLVAWNGGRNGARCADWSPDGQRVVAGFLDGSLRVWRRDALGFEVVATLRLPDSAASVAFAPDGRTILAASATAAHLFDAELRAIASFAPRRFTGAAYASAGEVLTVSTDGELLSWPVSTAELVERAERLRVRELTAEERRTYGHLLAPLAR